MIWEVDTNLNGYISYDEYERMYKRCVVDKKELEPKTTQINQVGANIPPKIIFHH